jgi:hypothetical protein
VEIPDAAVEKALDVLMDDGHNGIDCRPDRNFEVSVRAALVAARPYLMPDRNAVAMVIWRAMPGDVSMRTAQVAADAVLALLSTSGESGE